MRDVSIPGSLRPTPWLFERTITALMVGGFLLAFLVVALGMR